VTLQKDRKELTRQVQDLTTTNLQAYNVNRTLNSSNVALQDEVWSHKDSLEKLTSEVEELKTSVDGTKVTNEKLKSDIQSLKQDNRDLSGSKKYLQDKVEALERSRVVHKVPVVTQAKPEPLKTVQTATTVKVVAKTPSRGSTPTGTEIYMSSTAYTAFCNGCSGVTRTGIDLRANPNLKVIAVDPSVIPLGSKVHVEGYGYAVAGDTGGAIKGHKIDVFISGQGQALKWGKKKVKVTILN
jgi:3D (Asp-Asp-Asp) domain-containing protein